MNRISPKAWLCIDAILLASELGILARVGGSTAVVAGIVCLVIGVGATFSYLRWRESTAP